jgi:hypothetical protein
MEAVVRLKPRKRYQHRAVRPKLLTRASLDKRTHACKQLDAMVAAITADLGGADALSAVERSLVEAYASSHVLLESMGARIVRGEDVDALQFSKIAMVMTRIASRLGLKRRAKPKSADGEPESLAAYLASKQPPATDGAAEDDGA